MLKKEIRSLRFHMHDNQLEPDEDIIIDGKPHQYEAYIDGQTKEAEYTAMAYPFGRKSCVPALICCYSAQDKQPYFYSSLAT